MSPSEIDAFRAREAGRLHGFSFSDAEILSAVERVRERGLPITDTFVLAQLKLTSLGEMMRGEKP